MTIQRPEILFTAEVFHTYFTNSICKCLRFKPGPGTAALQKKFGFVIQQNATGNGFDFYMNTSSSRNAFLAYISSCTGYDGFDFIIETTDNRFPAFTDLPANWHGALIFDSKDGKNIEGSDQVLLPETLSANKSTTAVGNLTIRFTDLANSAGENNTVHYTMRLFAKATQWQYFLVNKNAVPLNDPGIIGNAEIRFEGPETVTIPSGQKALFFNSGKQLISLSEKPASVFSLVNFTAPSDEGGKPAKNKTIIKSLPCPDPVQFDLVQIDGIQQFSSPMYIFI